MWVYHSENDAIIKNSISFVSISLFVIHTVPTLVMSLPDFAEAHTIHLWLLPVILRYRDLYVFYNFNGTDLQSKRWNRSDFYFCDQFFFSFSFSSQIIFELNNIRHSHIIAIVCFLTLLFPICIRCFAFQIFLHRKVYVSKIV